MGIKGVYGEIGSGTRTALARLAVEKREQQNRNLRIAVDFSIWQHQVQLGKGGTNADLRTLFFRLLRLFRHSIEPLFVFDGPHKPPFKRNKRTNVSGGSALQLAAREFFDLLGFPCITAPGEAEAECALLQREGVVDAVLSEDVDTLMFGCTTHLRAWGPEDRKKKGDTATHLDVYRAEEIKSGPSGLDREGLILLALMSGGDYLPAGIPNCGIKIACEAARAGFGSDLQKIDRNDIQGTRAWRDRLQHELHTNESNFFRVKHRTLEIPETFPDKAVLYYYSNPVVSTSQQVERYRRELRWREPNVERLREACKTSFGWYGVEGFYHFTRNIAPALLGWRLANGSRRSDSYDDIDVQSAAEESLIKTISGQRSHASTGYIPELRIAYIPQEIVGLTVHGIAKEDHISMDDHTAEFGGEEQNAEAMDTEEAGDSVETTKKRVTRAYDPAKIEREWLSEAYIKLGAPGSYEKWKAEQLDPKKFATRKARVREKEKEAMPRGAIKKYLQVDEPGAGGSHDSKSSSSQKAITSPQSNVSFLSHPSLDYNLTKPETSSTLLTSKACQAVSRSKSSTNKTTKTISALAGHTRVTKPNSELSRPEKMINTKTFNQEDIPLLSSVAFTKTGATATTLHGESLVRAFIDASSRPAKTIAQHSDSDFHDLEILETVCTSNKATEIGHCDVSVSKTEDQTSSVTGIFSHNHFKARPNHNPWQDMEGEDALFETPAPKKGRTVYVDLTLS